MSPNNSGIYPQHFVSITKNSKCDVKQHMHCLLQVLLSFLTKDHKANVLSLRGNGFKYNFSGEGESNVNFLKGWKGPKTS